MPSQIENKLSKEEKTILELYRNPQKNDVKRMIRLSIQYAIASGIFVFMTIFYKEPLYSLAVYLFFLGYILIRVKGAQRISGIMPSIIEKYENTIKELKKIKSNQNKVNHEKTKL